LKSLLISIDSNHSLCINDDISYESSIFNEKKFIFLNSIDYIDTFIYFLIENKTMLCKGLAAFGENSKKVFESPLNGSFGGFEFKDDVYFDTKEKFINLVLKDLNERNYKSIKITLPPDIYNIENNSHQISILLRNQFIIKNIEINQFIDLSKYDIKKSVKPKKRQCINNCKRKNIYFRILEYKEYEIAYKIILENRNRKKYKISMSWDALIKTIRLFPDKFLNFGLFDDNKIIAAAICIKVADDLLYVFYWGESDEYEKISPISFLSHKLVEFCKLNKITTIDLGTSSLNSKPNIGLINFKKSIGADSCLKYKLEKIRNS